VKFPNMPEPPKSGAYNPSTVGLVPMTVDRLHHAGRAPACGAPNASLLRRVERRRAFDTEFDGRDRNKPILIEFRPTALPLE
jgi:hypothetical protein